MNKRLWRGDNLQILQDFPSAYFNLIYLDPPFNTGKDWGEFDDTWETDEKYVEFMRERLQELHRVLHPNGSIYLHCDPESSYLLKPVMDQIFGKQNYRNTLIWKRTSAHCSSSVYGRIHDTILFYTKSKNFTWGDVRIPHKESYLNKKYRRMGDYGLWRADKLLQKGARGDALTPQVWRGIDPTKKDQRWNPSRVDSMPEELRKKAEKQEYQKLSTLEKMEWLDRNNLIHWTKGGLPEYRRYLCANRGNPLQDLIFDIAPVLGSSGERSGYPTQKPLELLERLVLASSKEGDLILDPFCGSGTTLVAGLIHRRIVVGIDKNPAALGIAVERLRQVSGPA